MSEQRTEAAIEAAARAFHEIAREDPYPHWESLPEEGRRKTRVFVRPMVEAALEAAEAYMAATIPKPGEPR